MLPLTSRVVRRAMVAFGLFVGLAAPGHLAAQAPSADWQTAGLHDEAVVGLQAPASGAFFATIRRTEGTVTTSSVHRSDDGGDTWRPVELPPGLSGVRVDPVDHTLLYAVGRDGLHRSSDDGASWAPILTRQTPAPASFDGVDKLALSGADRGLIYVASSNPASSFRLVRSRDGGATWERAFEAYGNSSSCFFVTQLLQAHAVDSARLMLVTSCRRATDSSGADFAPLRQSADQGTTWERVGSFPTGKFEALIGWRGAMPERLYLALSHSGTVQVDGRNEIRTRGSSIHRSDDEGRTWTLLLTTVADGAPEPGDRITALTYDPARPDVVYIAVEGGVRASNDGGVTWTELGRQDLPRINDLALGVDRQNLYAATEQGLYRLRLASVVARLDAQSINAIQPPLATTLRT